MVEQQEDEMEFLHLLLYHSESKLKAICSSVNFLKRHRFWYQLNFTTTKTIVLASNIFNVELSDVL